MYLLVPEAGQAQLAALLELLVSKDLLGTALCTELGDHWTKVVSTSRDDEIAVVQVLYVP